MRWAGGRSSMAGCPAGSGCPRTVRAWPHPRRCGVFDFSRPAGPHLDRPDRPIVDHARVCAGTLTPPPNGLTLEDTPRWHISRGPHPPKVIRRTRRPGGRECPPSVTSSPRRPSAVGATPPRAHRLERRRGRREETSPRDDGWAWARKATTVDFTQLRVDAESRCSSPWRTVAW